MFTADLQIITQITKENSFSGTYCATKINNWYRKKFLFYSIYICKL